MTYYPYLILQDNWEPDGHGRKKKRMTSLINVYDNNLDANQVWCEVKSSTRCKALANVECDRILKGRAVLMGDFNVYSP